MASFTYIFPKQNAETSLVQDNTEATVNEINTIKKLFRNNLKEHKANANNVPFKANNIAQIYKFPKPTNNPVTISVISFGGGLFGNLSSSGILSGGDVQAYWTSIGISTVNQPKVIIIPVNGAKNAPVKDQNETSENTIDISMIGACCATSKLTIILYISPNI